MLRHFNNIVVHTHRLDAKLPGGDRIGTHRFAIRPAADPHARKGGFWQWLTEGRRARTEAALLAQHGKFLMAYTQELHKEVVPANGRAVAEICGAALDVVHNQQLRRRAASAFQAVVGILGDYSHARADIELIRQEIGDEAVDAALQAAEQRFRQCLEEISPTGNRPDRLRVRSRSDVRLGEHGDAQ